jgi:hypothetical protein
MPQGTNRIVVNDPERIVREALTALDGKGKAGRTPVVGDGRNTLDFSGGGVAVRVVGKG